PPPDQRDCDRVSAAAGMGSRGKRSSRWRKEYGGLQVSDAKRCRGAPRKIWKVRQEGVFDNQKRIRPPA
ncbi:MAG: hypothetical protein ABI637_08320, partial [Gemmatimonadota bacterium]